MSGDETPSTETLRRARMFWEQSGQDLKEARRQLRAGASLESGYFSLQAALNALSAVCILHGHVQLPQTSTLHMLALCREEDPCFDHLGEACTGLEAAAEQSPFRELAASSDAGGDKAAGEAAGKAHLEQCDSVIKTVRGYLKDNRKRFFAP